MKREWVGWILVLGGLGIADAGESRAVPVTFSTAVACSARVEQHADAGNEHARDCSPLNLTTNPPSSGRHYDNWAAYKTYSAPVPQGFLVHSLEHGAVVIGYNCPLGCAEEVAQVEAWIGRLPPDVSPCQGLRPKVILAPNPELDMRWGAAAWAWTWKAACPDTASLVEFFRDHYNRTDEAAVCGGGMDLAEAGWCPASLGDRRVSPGRNLSNWPSRLFEGRNLAGRRATPYKPPGGSTR